MNISMEEQERAIYRSRRMYQTDQQSNLANAEDRGRAKGRIEEKIEITCNLLKIGLPLDQVALGTGLTIEEVNHLRAGGGE